MQFRKLWPRFGHFGFGFCRRNRKRMQFRKFGHWFGLLIFRFCRRRPDVRAHAAALLAHATAPSPAAQPQHLTRHPAPAARDF